MLWRKLLMTGVAAPALSTHWIIPGGRILTMIDGQLRTVYPASGWPQWSDAGDPFKDADGRYGTYELQNLGGGIGQALSIRLRNKGSDREDVRSLGPYRGWASENVAVGLLTPGTESNPFGYTRPSWDLTAVAGGGAATRYTADWPWEQQSNGTSAGESTLPDHVQVIQASYLPHMAYPSGVCVARDLGVVTRLPARAITGDDSVGPFGREWLGWTIDAAGIVRRIADLSPAQARQLGRDHGFVPPDDAIIEAGDQVYDWQFLRPIGPVGHDAVLATGCLRYEESYTRHATMDERPYFSVGRAGANSNHQAEPLLDGPVNWLFGADRPPITITERRACFIFCSVLIRAGGIASIGVTGSSVARSTQVEPDRRPGVGAVGFNVFKRKGGGYDLIWESHPQHTEYGYRGETFATQFVTSPNGWRTPILWPVHSPDGIMDHGEIVREYEPAWFAPDDELLGSTPPPKPDDWDEEEQGPWVVPPYDVDESYAWRGMRYWWPSTQEWHWQQSQNSTFSDYGRYGSVAEIHPMYPAGPYPRDGAGQWYGRGEFVVARHQDGTLSSHAAGLIVPGITSGPGGSVPPHAEPDGMVPVMRLLRWPGRSHALRMLQDGSWAYSPNGRAWTPITDLGPVQGTQSVAATLAEPDDE